MRELAAAPNRLGMTARARLRSHPAGLRPAPNQQRKTPTATSGETDKRHRASGQIASIRGQVQLESALQGICELELQTGHAPNLEDQSTLSIFLDEGCCAHHASKPILTTSLSGVDVRLDRSRLLNAGCIARLN